MVFSLRNKNAVKMYANQYLMQGQFSLLGTPEHTIVADTIEYAEDSFVDAKERLLDVSNWKRYSNIPGVAFVLKDSHGREVRRRAHKGDHIKINVPAQGIDCCVVIDALEYDDYPDLRMEAFTMRLRPCMHTGRHDDEETDNNMEAALIIERKGKQLFTVFYTKNITANTNTDDETLGLTENDWNSMLKKFVD